MAQAFLHGDEHIGIAAGLDEDDPIRAQARQVERWGKQVTPAQAPQDRALRLREDTSQEDGRRRIVA